MKAVIFGSDQIWSPKGLESDPWFALGAAFPDSVRKFSYACSLGGLAPEGEMTEIYREALSSFENVSIREMSGAVSLQKIGVACTNDVDPTLLLSEAEWDEAIARFSKRRLPKRKYALVYSLGSSSLLRQLSTEYSAVHETQMIDLLNMRDPYYLGNHFDFLQLIKHSEVVFSDSFHCLVFSIIYKKRIWLFERTDHPAMWARIVALLQYAGYQNPEPNKLYDFSETDVPSGLPLAIARSKKKLDLLFSKIY